MPTPQPPIPLRAATIAAGAALLLLGCATCDESGCKATELHADDQGTGIAGVVAVYDDVQEDGCSACPLSRAELQLWRVDARIEDDETARLVVSTRGPDASVDADGYYVQPLFPGHHLLCASEYTCVSIEVTDGETLTVNLLHPLGDGGYFVGGPEDELEQVETLRVEL